jgi:O-antigen/teichoic acid export membrane protein
LYFSFAVALAFSSALTLRYYFKATGIKDFSFKAIVGMGFIFQASTLLFIFMNRYSYNLLNDRAAVGLYATACSLMEAVLIISNGVAPVLLARLANDKPGIVSLGLTVILAKICFLLSLLAVILLWVLPDMFFTAIIGNGFAGIKNIMLLYAPATLLQSVLILLGSYYTARGKQKYLLVSYGCGGLTALVLAPYLVAAHGLRGAAYSADIAYGIATVSVLYFMARNENFVLADFFSLRKDADYIRKLRFSSGE